jgi:urea transport system permease protein
MARTLKAGPVAAAAGRRPRGAARAGELGAALVVVLALAALPMLADGRTVALVARFLVLGLAAMSLDLLWGYAGQLSFGHAAFFGMGAYTAALTLDKLDVPGLGLVAVGLAVAVPTLFALVMGVVLFYGRVRGVYFGIVTLLIALLCEQLATTWTGFTGGSNGVIVTATLALGPLRLDSLESTYYTVLAVCLAALLATVWLVRGPLGRALVASRLNEPRAESLGYDVAALRTVVLCTSAALAGLAGAMYVPVEGFVYPAQLGIVASTGLIVWVTIGGRGTLLGAFLGAFAVNYLESLLSGRLQSSWLLVTGVFLVVIVLVQPKGILGFVRAAARRLRPTHDRAQPPPTTGEATDA